MKDIVIYQRDYAIQVENSLEDRIEGLLFDFVKDKSHDYDFDWKPIFDVLHDVYVDYAADIRDIAIQVLEESGFLLRGDGGDY